MDRDENSFWAVWKDGQQWPSLMGNEQTARQKVEQLALKNPGQKIHLMKLVPVGDALLSAQMVCSGKMREE